MLMAVFVFLAYK
jgi:serine/threonine protein kinase